MLFVISVNAELFTPDFLPRMTQKVSQYQVIKNPTTKSGQEKCQLFLEKISKCYYFG